jgi:peptidoglycan/LPS O-acetylase OafA/YrhL
VRSFNSSYIPAVDHIRAFAATLVLFQHSHAFIGGRLAQGQGGNLAGARASSPLDALVIEGHTGVALFMVLSGFIFTHIAYGKDIRYGPFLLNRFLRIYPLLIAIFVLGFVLTYPNTSPTGFLAVLAIPVQVIGPVDLWFVPSIYPFTTLFWTIAPEFQFYVLFPIILGLVYRYGPSVLAILLVGATVLRVLLVVDGAAPQDLSYWTVFGRIDQFLIGMGAAIFYRAVPTRRLELLSLAVLAVLPFLLFAFNQAGGLENQARWKVFWPTTEGALWAAFIVGYLHLAQRIPGWLSRGLAQVGEVSFSMYLLHVAVIAAVLKLGPFTFGLEPTGASVLNALLLVLPATIAVSWVTFRLIERPFLSLRVHYLGRSRSARFDRVPGNAASYGAAK